MSAQNRRKVSHVSRACNMCRRKKSKCDGVRPKCKSCLEYGHECTWTAEEDSRRPASKQYVESLKTKATVLETRVAELEAILRQHGIPTTGFQLPPSAGIPLTGASDTGFEGFINIPQPPGSAGHSPNSWTSDLPSDTYLDPGELSDSGSIQDSLSAATARLKLGPEGALGLVGPSSVNFHRAASPITRDLRPEEQPKHQLIVNGVAQEEVAAVSRSRAASTSRSATHSRSGSFVGSPTSPGSPYAGQNMPGIPGPFDAGSPASDVGPVNSLAPPGTDLDFSFLNPGNLPSPSNASPQPNEQYEEYQWNKILPPDVDLTRTEHDTLLDTFFKFFASWCFRTNADLFLRDMRTYLTAVSRNSLGGQVPETPQATNSQTASSAFDSSSRAPGKVSKTTHYSPMLHNAILALALSYHTDQKSKAGGRRLKGRRIKFVERAKLYLDEECAQPSLACVQALSYLASYYSGQGDQTLGFLYFGMSIRMVQALGLTVDCSPWVRSGKITEYDEQDRVWTYWSTFCLDKCWTFYVGRDLGLPVPLIKAPNPAEASSDGLGSAVPPVHEIRYPQVDPNLDELAWKWSPPAMEGYILSEGRSGKDTANHTSLTFLHTCMLMTLASKVMSASLTQVSINALSDLALQVDGWLDNLPKELELNRPKTTNALPHVLMLHMAHQWIQILLHRPYYRNPKPDIPSPKRCDAATEKIILYLNAWRRLYQLKYVPITAVQISYIAGTTALLQAVQSVSSPEKRRKALEGVKECIRALNEMGSTWLSAHESAKTLSTLLKEQTDNHDMISAPNTRAPTIDFHPPTRSGTTAFQMDMSLDYMIGNSSTTFRGPGIVIDNANYVSDPTELGMFGLGMGMQTIDSPTQGSPHSFTQGHEFGDPRPFGHSPIQTPSPLALPGNISPDLGSHTPQLQHPHSAGINIHQPVSYANAPQTAPAMFQSSFPAFEQHMGTQNAGLRSGESFAPYPVGPVNFNPRSNVGHNGSPLDWGIYGGGQPQGSYNGWPG